MCTLQVKCFGVDLLLIHFLVQHSAFQTILTLCHGCGTFLTAIIKSLIVKLNVLMYATIHPWMCKNYMAGKYPMSESTWLVATWDHLQCQLTIPHCKWITLSVTAKVLSTQWSSIHVYLSERTEEENEGTLIEVSLDLEHVRFAFSLHYKCSMGTIKKDKNLNEGD